MSISNAASADSIPNSGFESWIISQWFIDPLGWSTNNSHILAPTVVQDTDAYAGSLAMKLTNSGSLVPAASCNFTISSHPENLGFQIKNLLGSGDSGTVVVRIFYHQQLVDSGYTALFGGINPNYTPFILPISQNSINADSCEIVFTGGQAVFAEYSIDEIQFDMILGYPIIEGADFSLYPNPFRNYIFLENHGKRFDFVEVYDIVGKYFKTIDIKNSNNFDFLMHSIDAQFEVINTESLPMGAWMFVFRTPENRYSQLLIRE